MHGQRSYNPQFGRSPYRPMPPPYQQRPLGPPHFQQGLPSPAMYQHGHPSAPPHQIHHAPPQSYVHSSLPARGSTPVSLMYPTPQQNTQNPHQGHRPMPHPPGTSHEELFQAPPLAQSLPPAPSRSQGQTIYRPPLHPLPQQSGVLHALQHPLPPSMSNFFTSAQLTSTVHLTGGNPHVPSLAPLRHHPPLPSSPLIQPPPPPPLPSSPSTSKPSLLASNLSCHLNNEYCSSELSVNKLMISLPANEVIASNQVRPNLFADDHSLNQGGESSIKVGFLAGDGLSSKGSLMFDKLDTEKSYSPMRPLENEPSTQPCQLKVASMSNSPADSDMEMEDDMTQVANDLVPSVEGLNNQQDLLLLPKELYASNQSCSMPGAAQCNLDDDRSSKKTPPARCLGWGEQGNSSFNQVALDSSVTEVNLFINSEEAKRHHFTSNVEYTLAAVDKSASSAAAAFGGINSDKYSAQLATGDSSFKHLQDYASDENDAEPGIDTSQLLPSTVVDATVMHKDIGFSESGKSLVPCSDLTMLDKATEVLQGSGNGTLNSSGTVNVDDKCRNRILTKQDSAVETSKKDDVVLGASTEIGSSVLSKDDNAEKKNENLVPSLPKVDKFGRLVREGTSDSNSDDSYYCRRRSRRDRSRSRSWSPLRKRRQRRRSPRKRREQRSRSRSQSPRNCRSRSRSPRNRRSRSSRNRRSRSRSPKNRRSRSRSPIVRKGKGRVPNCFDYSRGRCHRGADCRYVHHVYDESRVKRVEQQSAEVLAGLRTCAYEVIRHLSEKVSERAKSRSPDRQPRSNFGVSKDGNADEKREDSLNGGATQSADVNLNGQLIDYHIHNSENSCDFPAPVLATPVTEKETEGPTIAAKETCAEIVGSDTASKYVCDIDNLKAYENASEEKLSGKLVADQKSHSNLSDRLPQSSDALPQKSDSSSVSGSWPRKSSTHSLSRPVMNDSCPDRMQSEHSSSQLPPSSLPFSQDVDISDMKIPETLLSSVQSTAGESFPSYMLPNQQSFFPVQPNSSLTSLQHPRMNPPNDLSVNIGTSASGVSSQCQQGQMLLRKDLGSHTILKPYQTEVSSHSQVGGFQQQGYPPNQSFMHAAFPVHNLPSQKLEDPNLLREHFLTQPPLRSVGRGGAHILAMPSLQELPTSKVPLFSGQGLPPHVLSNSSSNVNPYSQQQQPPSHSSHNPVADSAFHLPGNISSSYRHPSEFVNTNQQLPPSYHHHHHPHTVTFEQPVGSNHNFGVFRQDKDATNGTTGFSLRHAPYDGQSAVSQKASFLPDSARSIGQNFPRSGGDQYDPLFDSVEPYSNFSGKRDHVQNWEATGDSEVIRFSVSSNPLDMEGNKKIKDGGGVASAASSDNEEFGETADAEVGVVENNSPISNPISVEKTSGDIEIDQIKSPGKRKKSRDSKSMRPFKVAIANFVKEVLKPSWRQGNMSKEAFKTIVKKTVDKVSGAMKRNQIPKSQPKIDHYIDSSQRKLTKLVMGYVDKYVKV